MFCLWFSGRRTGLGVVVVVVVVVVVMVVVVVVVFGSLSAQRPIMKTA
jgi:hypothetical protein